MHCKQFIDNGQLIVYERNSTYFRYVRTQMFRSDRGDRPNVPNYLVVLTDGKSNHPEQTWIEAMRAREQGIITTIGIGGGT